MYITNCRDEVVIKLIGKLTLEFPNIDQLKARIIVDEVLYDYDILPQEKSLVASDVEEKMQIFLATKKLDGLSLETLKGYQYDLLILAQFIIKPVAAITTIDLRRFLAQRCGSLKKSSTNGQITMLKTFFGWLADEGYIPNNPAKKLKKVKQPKRVRQALSKKEIEQIRFACITERDRALVEFMYSTGCRLSELVKTNVSDINWNERTLFVVGKGDKEREISFDAKAELYIQKYLDSRKDNNDALFVATKGNHNRLGGRSIERDIEKIARRAGISKPVSPHVFRHSFATHMLNSGVPMHIVQEWLGHSSVATTQIYAVADRENLIYEHRRAS
ncbi:site-specific tyrosine recombinase/integron integrase [Clostridium sp. DL1XJH146]